MGIRSRTNIPVTALALAVLGFCSYLLYQDFFFLVYSNPADSIGEITYRFRVAQRRGASSVVWENADQGSKVYNRNFVRTDAESEAMIVLKDKTVIELDPDSMVMLEVRPGESRIRFERGSILVRRGPDAVRNKLLLMSGDQQIPVKGPGLRIMGAGDDLRTTPLQDAKELLQFPPDNYRAFSTKGAVKLRFSWRPKGAVKFYLSRDPGFSKIIRNREAQAGLNLNLQEGVYYWRIRVKGRDSHFRKFRILPKLPLQLLSPATGKSLQIKTRERLVPFAWASHALASAYIIEISKSKDFSSIYRQKRVYRSRISVNLNRGVYFWRVRSFSKIPGAQVQSSSRRLTLGAETQKLEKVNIPKRNVTSSLKAAQPLEPVAPRLISPRKTVDMTTRDYILFRWKKAPGALDYEFRLFRRSKLLYSRKTKGTRLRFSDLSKLDVGRFRWKVRARFPVKGTVETRESSQVFRIILKEAPGKPELE